MQMGVECQPDMISLTAATKHGAWVQCPSDSAQSQPPLLKMPSRCPPSMGKGFHRVSPPSVIHEVTMDGLARGGLGCCAVQCIQQGAKNSRQEPSDGWEFIWC